jgi:DNA-binding GntR family transcriptional regulator
MIPRRGARVLPLRADDMQEIYEILMALEPKAAAGLAARKPSAEDLAPLENAASAMEVALKRGNLDAWAAADDAFHLGLLDLHGNRRLKTIVTALSDQVHRARMITLRLREPPDLSNTEHRVILTALLEGDARAARDAFLEHRKRAAEELVRILVQSGIGQL